MLGRGTARAKVPNQENTDMIKGQQIVYSQKKKAQKDKWEVKKDSLELE